MTRQRGIVAQFPDPPRTKTKANYEYVQTAEWTQVARAKQLSRWNWLASRPMFFKAGMFWTCTAAPVGRFFYRRSRSIWCVLRRGI